MEKYPPVENTDDSPLNDLPSVPTHLPGTPSAMSAHVPNIPPAMPISNQNTPPPQIMKMPEPQPQPQPQPQPLNNVIELPTPTHFRLSIPMSTVEPRQLASWIVKNGTGPQPSVLLLDVRPRDIHSQGFIRHRWVAQIEPLVIKPK
jgi:ubiquitin carboxyl-terminal hydrolase 8